MVSRVGPYTAMAAAPGTQYSGLANLMAMQGTGGDNTLVHMSKAELPYLNTLARAAGHTNGLPINPKTGLPEANILKSILPIAGGILGTMLLPGVGTALGTSLFSGAVGAGLAGGLGTFGGNLLAGKSLKDAAIGGLISGGLSGLGAATFGGQSLFGDPLTATPTLTGQAAAADFAPSTTLAEYAGEYGGSPFFVKPSADLTSGISSNQATATALKSVNPAAYSPIKNVAPYQMNQFLGTSQLPVNQFIPSQSAPSIPAGRVSVEGLKNPANLPLKKGVTDISKIAADRIAGLPEKAGWLDMGTVYGGIPEGVSTGEYLKYAAKPIGTQVALGIGKDMLTNQGAFAPPKYQEPEVPERRTIPLRGLKFDSTRRGFFPRTEEEALAFAQPGGVRERFFDQSFTVPAKTGGGIAALAFNEGGRLLPSNRVEFGKTAYQDVTDKDESIVGPTLGGTIGGTPAFSAVSPVGTDPAFAMQEGPFSYETQPEMSFPQYVENMFELGSSMLPEFSRESISMGNLARAAPTVVAQMTPATLAASALYGFIGQPIEHSVQAYKDAYSLTTEQAIAHYNSMEQAYATPIYGREDQFMGVPAVEPASQVSKPGFSIKDAPSALVLGRSHLGALGLPEAPGFGPAPAFSAPAFSGLSMDPDFSAAVTEAPSIGATTPSVTPPDVGLGEYGDTAGAPSPVGVGLTGPTFDMPATASMASLGMPEAAGFEGIAPSAPSSVETGLGTLGALGDLGPGAAATQAAQASIEAATQQERGEEQAAPITSALSSFEAINPEMSAIVGYDITPTAFTALQEAEAQAGFPAGWDPKGPPGRLGWGPEPEIDLDMAFSQMDIESGATGPGGGAGPGGGGAGAGGPGAGGPSEGGPGSGPDDADPEGGGDYAVGGRVGDIITMERGGPVEMVFGGSIREVIQGGLLSPIMKQIGEDGLDSLPEFLQNNPVFSGLGFKMLPGMEKWFEGAGAGGGGGAPTPMPTPNIEEETAGGLSITPTELQEMQDINELNQVLAGVPVARKRGGPVEMGFGGSIMEMIQGGLLSPMVKEVGEKGLDSLPEFIQNNPIITGLGMQRDGPTRNFINKMFGIDKLGLGGAGGSPEPTPMPETTGTAEGLSPELQEIQDINELNQVLAGVPVARKRGGLISSYAMGGAPSPYFEGRVVGRGDGMSDSIPFSIENQQPAILSRDEYVLPADIVSMMGNGSSDAGSEKIDSFINDFRVQKYGRGQQPPETSRGLRSIV